MPAFGTFGQVSEQSAGRVDGTVLTGVSETALLTLKVRATEAARPDGIIDDPMAVQLADAIDYDWGKFGFVRRQDMALRALGYDSATGAYLREHPAATVVALAEGFQTSFHRLDAAGLGHDFRWLTVDLPPMIELRGRLLPACDRVELCAQSALDYSWMDRVRTTDGVFITAEGLLMYLQPSAALDLITECAKRFTGGRMMFDLAPPILAPLLRRGVRTSLRYKIPPMPFTMSVAQLAGLPDTVPGVRAVHRVPIPRGRGRLFNALGRTIEHHPAAAPLRAVWALLEFG